MEPDERRIEVIDEVLAGVFRAKSGPERLRIAHDLWTLTRDRLEAYLRFRHPDWDDASVRREVAGRLSGGSL